MQTIKIYQGCTLSYSPEGQRVDTTTTTPQSRTLLDVRGECDLAIYRLRGITLSNYSATPAFSWYFENFCWNVSREGFRASFTSFAFQNYSIA
jgi:hypothetical protein